MKITLLLQSTSKHLMAYASQDITSNHPLICSYLADNYKEIVKGDRITLENVTFFIQAKEFVIKETSLVEVILLVVNDETLITKKY